MTGLVTLENKEPVTTSLIIAEGVGVTHKSTMELIKKYENDIKEFGILPFETKKLKGAGRPKEHAILNEPQTYFLITLMRNMGNVTK